MTSSPGPQRSPRTTSGTTTPADASGVRTALQELGSAERAGQQHRFFQAYESGSGAGDQFLGIRVPALLSRQGDDDVPEALWTLARSGDLWRERVVVLATFAFIRAHVFGPTLELA